MGGRGDTLTNIHSGLTVVGGLIQIVSAVLSLLGAEPVDR